jgi:hypothetical protein
VNGEAVEEATTRLADQPAWRLDEKGRMLVDFPRAGEYDVVASYDGPPGWQIRNLLMVLLVLALLLCLKKRKCILSMLPPRRSGNTL